MKILITGATGFLGRNLVKFLLNKNYDLTVVGRDEGKLNEFFPQDFIVKIKTDYSLESLIKLSQDHDIVIHLASQLMQRDTHPLKISCFDTNLQTVENIVLACAENKIIKFINISSISVYPLEQNLVESQAVSPWNIYGVSKANIDIYLSYIQKKVPTQIVSLRLARLYGYGERSGLMFTDFVNKAIKKESLTVNGEGKSTIEYLYIEDAVEAIERFIENNEVKGIYNVGTGIGVSVQEIAEVVNQVFDNEENVTYFLDKSDGVVGSVMNVSKIEVDMRWTSKWNLLRSVQDIKIKIENEHK